MLALALFLACNRTATPVAGRAWGVGGWAPYWDLQTALDAVPASRGRVSDVFLFVAQLDGDGDPVSARPDDYARVVQTIGRSGAKTWLTVVNDVVDSSGGATQKAPGPVHDVLSDPARRRLHREKILELARQYGVSGVDLDYENLYATDRDDFSTFVAELAEDAHGAGLMLSVTVQPKSAESTADGTGAEDWAALCRSADRLQIMLYNEHSAKTAPGPLATPSWIDSILSFAAGQCAREKVIPALKVIGMEWSPGGTRDMPFAKAVALARSEKASVSRQQDGEVPWFSYGPGGERTVYYEDAQSLAVKLRTVLRRGAGGVVVWSLGQEDPAFWSVVEELQNRASSRSVAFTDW